MKRLFLTLALAAAGTASLHASTAPVGELVTLMSWDLSGAPGNQASTLGESYYEDTVETTDLVRGAGLTATAAGNSFSASGWTGQSTDYFQFGFTVAADQMVNLNSLTIATRSSATGPGSIGLFTSADNFASAIYTFDQAPGSNYVNAIIDLSGFEEITGTFDLRLKQIGTNAAGGGTTGAAGTFRISEFSDGTNYTDLTITGTAIPEPSTYAMILGGLTLGLVALRRRRA